MVPGSVQVDVEEAALVVIDLQQRIVALPTLPTRDRRSYATVDGWPTPSILAAPWSSRSAASVQGRSRNLLAATWFPRSWRIPRTYSHQTYLRSFPRDDS
jgi:hypothetical protein